MYEQSNAKLDLTSINRKETGTTMVTRMNLIRITSLPSLRNHPREQGRVVLHTKTETEVTMDDGSN